MAVLKPPQCRLALEEAIKHHKIQPRYGALLALARRLSTDLDLCEHPDLTTKLAARYQAALESLGLASRVATAPTAEGGAPTPLDEIRARRERLGRAEG